MSEFKEYKRKGSVELRGYRKGDTLNEEVSVSKPDREMLATTSFNKGDLIAFIARNPDDPSDVWLVSKEFAEKNYILEATSDEILMSTTNEHGWKLEELLEKLRKEVKAKSEKIKGSEHPQRGMILTNNGRIMEHLHNAISYQKETYRQLDATAPNRGPKHPRL